ncbi:MAG: thioredoxin family protein [Cyanobacteria bacterium P01_A01_bin.3]
MHVRKSAFNSETLIRPYTLISFGASWCHLCDLLHPILRRVVSEWNDAVDLLTVDVEQDWTLARQYGIRTLPALLLVEPDGRVVRRIDSFRNREDMVRQCEMLVRSRQLRE